MFVEGGWHSLCDFLWSITEATVVCRILGFSHVSGVTSRSAFGIGTVPMWLHELDCTGNESQLSKCPMDTRFTPAFLSHFCDSNKEAGVVCGTPNGK